MLESLQWVEFILPSKVPLSEMLLPGQPGKLATKKKEGNAAMSVIAGRTYLAEMLYWPRSPSGFTVRVRCGENLWVKGRS